MSFRAAAKTPNAENHRGVRLVSGKIVVAVWNVNCLGVTALDIWVSIPGPQEHLPALLVMRHNQCIVLSTQLLAKLGELHLLML